MFYIILKGLIVYYQYSKINSISTIKVQIIKIFNQTDITNIRAYMMKMQGSNTEESQAQEQRTIELKKLCRRIISKLDQFDDCQSNQNELKKDQLIGLAVFLFMRQQEKKMKQKYPSLQEDQITINLFKKWKKLGDQQKLEYMQKANNQFFQKISKKDRKQQKKREKDIKNIKDGQKKELLNKEIKKEEQEVDKITKSIIESKEKEIINQCRSEFSNFNIQVKQIKQMEADESQNKKKESIIKNSKRQLQTKVQQNQEKGIKLEAKQRNNLKSQKIEEQKAQEQDHDCTKNQSKNLK